MEVTQLVDILKNNVSDLRNVSAKDINRLHTDHGFTWKHVSLVKNSYRTLGRGVYDLTSQVDKANASFAPVKAAAAASQNIIMEQSEQPRKKFNAVSSVASSDVYIPERIRSYVPWGHFKTVESVLKSGRYFPLYVQGPSGNGKTIMIEQACAKCNKEYVRVQITPETDADSLIGGFRLIDGETVFQKGPVIRAMEQGALLLIDEIDRGHPGKLMALQGVLEGKPVLIQKTGETVKPAPGFNIIATANTTGRGDEDGRYSAATILDDAFLERFIGVLDQTFPPAATEQKIINNHAEEAGVNDEEFLTKIVAWAGVIRETFEQDGVDEVISTRRLCHIVESYSIFQDRLKAIEVCISRFDSDTKAAFLELYSMIDKNANQPVEEKTEEKTEERV
jgi:hypothetical protein